MNCPICNKELQLTDTFCPECGYREEMLERPDKVRGSVISFRSSCIIPNVNSCLKDEIDSLEQRLREKIAQQKRDLNDAQQK